MAMLATVSLPAQDAAGEQAIIAAERAIHEAVAKGNVAAFKQQVAADSFAIDAMMGRMATAEFIKSFPEIQKDMKLESWDITEPKVIWGDANNAVLTYKWVGKGTFQGQPIPQPRLGVDRVEQEKRQVDCRLPSGNAADAGASSSEEIGGPRLFSSGERRSR
jgi:hypothetical protein